LATSFFKLHLFQLLLQQIALIQEHDECCSAQHLGGTDQFAEDEGVSEAVYGGVFSEVFIVAEFGR